MCIIIIHYPVPYAVNRRLCAKLYLKGETQQVDRILEEFSRRYWECNTGTLYGSSSKRILLRELVDCSPFSVDLVHAVSYSLLLLNTDLHVAELTSRMSRNQFVRNTLDAIQTQLQPSPSAQQSTSDFTENNDSRININDGSTSKSDSVYRSKRSDSITSWNSISKDTMASSPASYATTQATSPGPQQLNGSTPSLQVSTSGHDAKPQNPSVVYDRAWEAEMENLLKVCLII